MDTPHELLLETARFRIVRLQRTTTEGKHTFREVIRHPGAVAVLPLVDDQRICLIRNYRSSVDRSLIELPAGTLEPGENPEQAARRELAEETGFRAGTIEPLQNFFMSPGILDERMHLFVAKDLVPGPPNREASEEIDNLIVDRSVALQMIRSGKIQDAKTLVGLLLLENLCRAP